MAEKQSQNADFPQLRRETDSSPVWTQDAVETLSHRFGLSSASTQIIMAGMPLRVATL